MWTTLQKSFHKNIKAGAPMQVMNHLRSWRFLGLKAELVSRASSAMVCSTRERVQHNAVTEKEMMSKFAMSPPEQQLMQSWTHRGKSRWAGNTQHLQGFLPSTRLACPHYTAFLLPGTPFSPRESSTPWKALQKQRTYHQKRTTSRKMKLMFLLKQSFPLAGPISKLSLIFFK